MITNINNSVEKLSGAEGFGCDWSKPIVTVSILRGAGLENDRQLSDAD